MADKRLEKRLEKRRRRLLWRAIQAREELEYASAHPWVEQILKQANAECAHRLGMEALQRAEARVQARRRWDTGWRRWLRRVLPLALLLVLALTGCASLPRAVGLGGPAVDPGLPVEVAAHWELQVPSVAIGDKVPGRIEVRDGQWRVVAYWDPDRLRPPWGGGSWWRPLDYLPRWVRAGKCRLWRGRIMVCASAYHGGREVTVRLISSGSRQFVRLAKACDGKWYVIRVSFDYLTPVIPKNGIDAFTRPHRTQGV